MSDPTERLGEHPRICAPCTIRASVLQTRPATISEPLCRGGFIVPKNAASTHSPGRGDRPVAPTVFHAALLAFAGGLRTYGPAITGSNICQRLAPSDVETSAISSPARATAHPTSDETKLN